MQEFLPTLSAIKSRQHQMMTYSAILQRATRLTTVECAMPRHAFLVTTLSLTEQLTGTILNLEYLLKSEIYCLL